MSEVYAGYEEANSYFFLIIVYSFFMTLFVIPLMLTISHLFKLKTVKNVPFKKKILFYSFNFIHGFISFAVTVFVVNQLEERYEGYAPFITPFAFFLKITILMPLGYLYFVKKDRVDYLFIIISFTLSTFFAFTLVLLSSENGFLGLNFPDFISLHMHYEYFTYTYFFCNIIHTIMYIRTHNKYMDRNIRKYETDGVFKIE